MRKLAREAVIFMLLAMLLGFVGTFIFQIRQQSLDNAAQRTALSKNCAPFEAGTTIGGKQPFQAMSTENLDGTFFSRAECTLVFGEKKYPVVAWDRGVTLSDKDQARYAAALAHGKTILDLKIDYPTVLFVSAFIGAWSFIVGLGLWLFYRLIRFAVKG